jgi:hypothetical protein
MDTNLMAMATALDSADVLDRVRSLARAERRATAAFVAHLSVVDERRLYLAEGYSSMFAWCTEALHLAEGAAYNRIECARAARRFPAILDMPSAGPRRSTT